MRLRGGVVKFPPQWRFKIGDRVKRPVDIYARRLKWRSGTVVARYGRYGTGLGDYPELYMVLWDDGIRERGFMQFGLDREQNSA